MNLYLVRHAEAEKLQPGRKDSDRKLTRDGKDRIKNAADQWLHFIKKPDFICTSPYVRAVETAEIIAKSFDFKKEIIIDKSLAAGCLTKDLIELVNSLDGEDIMVVGHQPDLSEHVSNLISARGAFIEFKKASIAKISFNGRINLSKGYLEYLIPAGAFLK